MSSRLGLSSAEVSEARARAGWNELPTPPSSSALQVFARQFASVLILILVVAAGIALILGEALDAITIGMVIVLNALLGFVQEWRSERALESLRSLMSPTALVIRDGVEQQVPARDLVPGDRIILDPGSKVPADATLVISRDIEVDESILTGESLPVNKANGDEVFAGTAISQGRAEATVVRTGTDTEFGQVAALTGSVDQTQTNLQRQLTRVAQQLGIAALVVAIAVAILGVVMGREVIEMVMTGLSLAVAMAMVPEGLPAVVTITLALGAAAMVRQKALARRLQAIETLGAASVICSDKTGTLTENMMTATQIWTPRCTYNVTGTGYDPAGHIADNGARLRATDDPVLDLMLQTALACTHAQLRREDDRWAMIGAPTEGALVTLAFKGWAELPHGAQIIEELPFSSDRKRMSVLMKTDAGAQVLTKGAPETVLPLCATTPDGPMSEEMHNRIRTAYTEMGERGLRVIALAHRPVPDARLEERDLIFLGLVGLIDPPRAEVRDAISAAKRAGIRVLMITGDSPITARAIADQLALRVDDTITGTELDAMDDPTLTKRLAQNVLFARTRPAHKMRIVQALQAQDQIVAMTGDGVNDAPALKQADIGVSMGIRGTDVARDASDLVLLDDNFATIIRAIGEGRRQFSNVQKFVRYLLSSNAGEVIALVINILIGGPLIFLATQILWMNLITDGVTAVALGLEKAEPNQIDQPPRAKSTPILGSGGIIMICLFSIYTGGASLWIFFHLLDDGTDLARTTAFTAMVIFEKVSVFAFRSFTLPGWRIGYFSNPWLLVAFSLMVAAQVSAVYWVPLQAMLSTVPMGLAEWQLIGAFCIPLLIVPELIKTLRPTQRVIQHQA